MHSHCMIQFVSTQEKSSAVHYMLPDDTSMLTRRPPPFISFQNGRTWTSDPSDFPFAYTEPRLGIRDIQLVTTFYSGTETDRQYHCARCIVLYFVCFSLKLIFICSKLSIYLNNLKQRQFSNLK